MSSVHHQTGSSTLADLESMPRDDGKRYELVNGHIVVSPWPKHYGGVSFRLGPVLASALPPQHASYRLVGLDLHDDQRVIPDLCVAPHSSIGDQRLRLPVLLIVEVLSGLGADEMELKRAAYAAAEVPAYWLIDPDEPHVTCLRLEDGRYTTYAEGTVVTVEWPLPVTIDVPVLAQ